MVKLLKMPALFVALTTLTFLVALPAFSVENSKASEPNSTLINHGDVAGLWVKPRNESMPYGAIYSQRDCAVLGFTKNRESKGHDFAIVAEQSGVRFQVIDEKGGIHSIPATALLKLIAEEDAWTVADKPVAGEAPAHNKILYRIARDRAVAKYAKDKGITRAAARDLADQIDDSTVHAAVKAAGIEFKDLAVGSKLEDVLNWIVNHQELIAGLVKIFLTLLALL